jgi:hypothetical protein
MSNNPSPAPRGLLDIRPYDAEIRQRAAGAASNLNPAAPEIPPLPKTYGLADALGQTGKVLDYQNLGTTGLLAGHGIASKSNRNAAANTIKALDNGFFKWVGRVLTPAEEIARGVGDMQRGVSARVAVPGTALRIGGRLAAATAGAEAGMWAGTPFGPVGIAIGGVGGGLIGGMLGDKLPDRETLGANAWHGLTAMRGLLNSFDHYVRQPPAGARHGFTGTP